MKKDNKKIVDILYHLPCKGQYLKDYNFNGIFFGDILFEELNKCEKYYKTEGCCKRDYDEYELLQSEIIKQNKKVHLHPSHTLHKLLENNTTINFEFAKQLKLYDIVNTSCFHIKNEIGEAMIWLIDCAELNFVLSSREWISHSDLKITFEVGHYEDAKKNSISSY